ncbi:MAG: dipeptidase [Pseudomonadota bacterium]|nr:dipeptidase [Pseudomonadota bacterium]
MEATKVSRKTVWWMALVLALLSSATASAGVFALSSDGTMRMLEEDDCATADCAWIDIDRNRRSIALAATARSLFQLHDNGAIWIWEGRPCDRAGCAHWTRIDNNTRSVAIAANDTDLFQQHRDGTIWRWTGNGCDGARCPSWERLDANPRTASITAAGSSLFQLHGDGSIWRWTGAACSGTRCPGWQRIDRNPATRQIVAASPGNLYQRHQDGRVWRWDGRPCSGNSCTSWTMLDRNPATRGIVAAAGNLFQLHGNGAIWRWTGRACTAAGCTGWERLDANPATQALAVGPQPYVDDLSPGPAAPPAVFQAHRDGSVWRWAGSPCLGSRCPHWRKVSDGDAFSRYTPERSRLHVFQSAQPFVGLRPLTPGTLFGFVDLHAHPASFLGFGGRPDGRSGMMWGRPAVGEGFLGESFSHRWGTCAVEGHAHGGFDPIQSAMRELIVGIANGRTRAPHTPNGTPGFESWPSSLVLSHQQMDVEWLRRAHQGGLRAIVAAAVDNEVVDAAYGWGMGNVYSILRTALSNGDVRGSLGIPAPGFALQSARAQLDLIRQMVDENDFMEVALTGAGARAIVERGRLAVVLGVELDTLTPADLTSLVEVDGVRFVTPVHMVDNAFGGAAAYEMMFSALNGVIGAPAFGGVPQPYSLMDDANTDFFLRPLMEPDNAAVDRLTNSMFGWRPFGSPCAADATIGSDPMRPGCIGKRNRLGLAAGGGPIRDLISRGVMVDLAHMSQQSQTDSLAIAEAMNCPVVNSHTGMRADVFDASVPNGGLGNERAMRASDARRLLALGGVIGVGTGTGELDHPRRLYYNAGNPLIQFSGSRREWVLDLRQPETQQSFVNAPFREYRLTTRLGHDGLDPGNQLQARLLGPRFESRGGWTDTCVLNPGRTGHAPGTVLTSTCTLSDTGARRLLDVDGLRLDHDGACSQDLCTGDNVDIDEVRLEALALDGRGWITLVQRTGGHEGEVTRLKGVGSTELCRSAAGSVVSRDFGSHFWETRLLPAAGRLANMSGFQLQTFTNEDDLGASAPGAVTVGLSGHRSELRREFASGGIPEGTCVVAPIAFPSGREQPGTVTALRLSTGQQPTNSMLQILNAWRGGDVPAGVPAELSDQELDAIVGAAVPAAIGLAVAGGTSALGLAIADPVTTLTTGLGIWAIAELANGAHDNWSSQVSVRADTPAGAVPFLVNYNPVQRLKRDQPDSVLFRGLPERIDPNRMYAGVVVNYSTVNNVEGNELEMSISFGDERLSWPVAEHGGISGGSEMRTFLPFDRRRPGRSITRFALHSTTGADVRIRSLDIGLVTDPVESWTQAVNQFSTLGDFPTQIAMGTDLSGFEPLIPFTAIAMGNLPPLLPDAGGGSTRPVPSPIPGIATPPRRPEPVRYVFDIETAAGRPDPARPLLDLPTTLTMDSIEGRRMLSIHQTGVSTVGQLPDLAFAASQVDPELGRNLFSSVDGFVRAWEKLDSITGTGADARCR